MFLLSLGTGAATLLRVGGAAVVKVAEMAVDEPLLLLLLLLLL